MKRQLTNAEAVTKFRSAKAMGDFNTELALATDNSRITKRELDEIICQFQDSGVADWSERMFESKLETFQKRTLDYATDMRTLKVLEKKRGEILANA
jgi:hypothetical protein|tara:strand:+ start:385 stop:675 length:291 start_codon:yes stop_codon:yes gene_type:complete